jgi:hypothetical protein
LFLQALEQASRKEEREMIYVGVDWAEDHHDDCVKDTEGAVLGTLRVADSIRGIG